MTKHYFFNYCMCRASYRSINLHTQLYMHQNLDTSDVSKSLTRFGTP